MSGFSQAALLALEASASTCAAYLDHCDSGNDHLPPDPERYRAYAYLLLRIFQLVNPKQDFPALLAYSPSARELSESIDLGQRLEIDAANDYPELSTALSRAAN